MWQKIIGSKLYTGIFLSSVFAIGFLGAYFGLILYNKLKSNESPLKNLTQIQTPEPTIEPIKGDESFNTVLLGSGGDGHSGGGLTDSIIIASINSKDKKATLVSIPRDLWTPGNYKINATVNNIGVENLKGTLQNITGLKISKYASVDFSGIVKIIDLLGGIEVDIPKAFSDNFYPVRGLENETCGKSGEEIATLHAKYSGFELEKQFICRYEELRFDKGPIKIDGATALKIARSRHGDSDFGRSQRQFAIIKAILTKLISMRSFDNLKETFNTFGKIVKTDITLTQTSELLKVFGNPSEYKISEIHLTSENVLNEGKSADGQYILVPKAGVNNFSGIRSYISQP